jgi:hypothetical protein
MEIILHLVKKGIFCFGKYCAQTYLKFVTKRMNITLTGLAKLSLYVYNNEPHVEVGSLNL